MCVGDVLTPLVSICCLTYNHAEYIRNAIDGFLMQKTTFPFEILIHDDASTDNTAQIIREYELQYPHLIFPIYQKENQYSKGRRLTLRFNVPRARGKYIALCEGDDFWTDHYKLQKQVEFLEANPEYGLCYTNARMFYQKTNTYSEIVLGSPYKSFENLFLWIGIPTLTTVFRRSLLDGYVSDVLPHSSNWKMGDYPMWLYLATRSKLKLLESITATYRCLEESASRSKSNEKTLDFACSAFEIKNHFADKYHISDKIRRQYSLDFFCDELFLAFLVNRTELINQARAFFEINNFVVLRAFLALFTFFRKNRFALRVLYKLLRWYKQIFIHVYRGQVDCSGEGQIIPHPES
jgi:glycosyltransferase involved in cell wall biosynthesis